ncbi:MAG: sensor histidine kinase [Epsilonproteobacteria bacterium]|nr:sensor histidine kinase [Campylobacterota bacterium]
MLKLNQIYFRKFFLLFCVVFIVISVLGYYLIDKIEINNYKMMLKNMINQFDTTRKSLTDMNDAIKKIYQNTGVRITIIDFNGNVKFESNRKIEGMGNHINRPEILLSDTNKFGSSIRHSKSISKDLLYVSKKTNDYYIRMAFPLNNIKEKFFGFWVYAIFIFLGAMILAFWISLKVNAKIAHDLQNIKEGLDSIIDKKYDIIFDSKKCCKEFDVLTKQINKVSQRLEKRNRQKIKHTKKLKELNKQQSDIISAISHEFKNPVAAIVGYAQTVREDSELSQSIRDKFLDKVIKNAQKISFMIDRLSMAIKLENDNLALEISTFDIKPMLLNIRDMLLQKYNNRDIIIDVLSLKIKADEVMFENLFINLIENALKYSEYEIVVKLEGSFLSVKDKGIGISEDEIQKITKRFYRVDSLSWDNSIGIGLYIVKYILKLHQMDLVIKSEQGVGSEFGFDIANLA